MIWYVRAEREALVELEIARVRLDIWRFRFGQVRMGARIGMRGCKEIAILK